MEYGILASEETTDARLTQAMVMEVVGAVTMATMVSYVSQTRSSARG